MRYVRRHDRESAGAEREHFIPDMQLHGAGDDIEDLFVWMRMRRRFIAGLESVQGECRTGTGEGLAADALAHRIPRDARPVDLLDVHVRLLSLVTIQSRRSG